MNKKINKNKIYKNKKGMMLAEETLKTVIAVIVIIFLVYFLVSLYFGNLNEERQKSAEAVLERVSEIIKSSNVSGEVRAIGPAGWTIFSFTELEKPNSCAGKNCLCICDEVIDVFDRQLKECSDVGRCLAAENLQAFEKIEIKKVTEGTTDIAVKKSENKIIIEEIK